MATIGVTMHGPGKSDRLVVPVKFPNKTGCSVAERAERQQSTHFLKPYVRGCLLDGLVRNILS